MKANRKYKDARELTYAEFPTKWIWDQTKKKWSRRKSKRRIARLYHAHPT